MLDNTYDMTTSSTDVSDITWEAIKNISELAYKLKKETEEDERKIFISKYKDSFLVQFSCRSQKEAETLAKVINFHRKYICYANKH